MSGHVQQIQENTGPRQMKVLVLALPRSGTASLHMALLQLGYHSFHSAEWEKKPDMFLKTAQAIEAKLDPGRRKWTSQDWRQFLADYDCMLTDATSLLYDDILEAFPEAKVIINERDADKWSASMRQTIFKIGRWPSWPFITWSYPNIKSLVRITRMFTQTMGGDDPEGEGPRKFCLEWHKEVRQVVSGRDYLLYHIQDGWEPLCNFLGKEVPNNTFPRVNDTKQLMWGISFIWWLTVAVAAGKVMAGILPIAVAAVVYRRYNR